VSELLSCGAMHYPFLLRHLSFFILVAILFSNPTNGWSLPNEGVTQKLQHSLGSNWNVNSDVSQSITDVALQQQQQQQQPSRRRESFVRLLSTATLLFAPLANPSFVTANAAATASSSSSAITPEEIQRIRTGWEQINYLLDHFEEETTVCRDNGGECKRDANAIRKVLGLRSTTDPLFQVEKVFAKFKTLNLEAEEGGNEKLDALYDAAEDWNSSISLSNSMAFISQFGEYNPGGGKDEVLKYLLESKKQVVLARDALQIIMVNLGIPTTIAK
jgi:hypothetical protein